MRIGSKPSPSARALLATNATVSKIKVEGNPLHPFSVVSSGRYGASSKFAQASLLDIVAPEAPPSWAVGARLNPGPHEFHADPEHFKTWMRERGHLFLPVLTILVIMYSGFSAPLLTRSSAGKRPVDVSAAFADFEWETGSGGFGLYNSVGAVGGLQGAVAAARITNLRVQTVVLDPLDVGGPVDVRRILRPGDAEPPIGPPPRRVQ